MKVIKYISIFLIALLYSFSVQAQRDFNMQIVLDKPVDAGELKLFPGVKDKDSYWYLPNKLRLAKNEDGTPKLSFVKWVHNTTNGTNEGIGGGVLHCVFGFEITDEELTEARKELRKINGSGKIVGAVIYKSGTVAVSVPKINDPDKEEIVATSPAPTMEGNYVAVNMQLDKRSASLLWDSFDTPNPLVTFNFNMVLSGYNSPMEAKITMNREQVYDSQSFQAGVATPWLSAEIGVFVEELIDNGAITIEKIGENFSMKEAIDRTIQKATEEFFTPLGSSQGPSLQQLTSTVNSQNNKSFLDRASDLLNTSRRDARTERDAVRRRNEAERARTERENERNRTSTTRPNNEQPRDSLVAETPGNVRPGDSERATNGRAPQTPNLEEEPSVPSIAVVASYVVKKIKISGKKVITFKESYPTTIPMPFGGNLGVSRNSCPKCFVETNLDDPVFKQREILTLLDGLNANDFDKYINYGTVQLRKKHESGEYTYDEVRVTRKNFNQEGNLFKMLYGWKGDNAREKWFDYDYKVAWSFFGGNNFETDWESTNRSAINLAPPLSRKIVTIEADKDLLADANVRAVDVKLYYSLGGKEQRKQFTINPKKDIVNGQIEFMLPDGKQEYDYEVTWRLWGNQEKKSGRKTTSFETLYVDELPN
ncbi:conserved exported protein of unknown function [Tenacibaculum sp. 190130A14a]|uniref:Uncharacterized protein n=1 Tax=Tenacibaculum polynesiense TaxID=3137857 RepID=A0ABM9P9T9_9FLAO